MTRRHFSVRLPEQEYERLSERSHDTRVSESELARRYVSEGLRRDLHPAVTTRPGRAGGRPALASRPRLEVATLIGTWLANDRDIRRTADWHDISPGDVQAALAYYADFQAEIDEIIERKRRIAERYERVVRPATSR